jgi:ABC-2 type transport system permease protein
VAGILVQLKLRLVLNALRSNTAAKTSFIVSSVFALILAIATFAGLAALRHNGAAVDLTAVVYTTFAFGWLILPLLVFGLDSTLDPATLTLYPLRTGPLMTGLLAASATGAWPLANLIGELGITVGLAHGALAVVIAVVATVLQVLFCIALARCVTTALAGLLRSRRGRDLAALAIIPIFGLYETFAQVVPKAIGQHQLTAASLAGSTPGSAGCRRGWPRMPSRTPPPGTPAWRSRGSPSCWGSSSSSSPSGGARSAAPWSRRTPRRRRRPSAAGHYRSRPACSAGGSP